MLVKELQSLALDIRVLDENGEEIELSQLSELEEEMAPKFVTADDVGKAVESEGDENEMTFIDEEDLENEDDMLDDEMFGEEVGDDFDDYDGN